MNSAVLATSFVETAWVGRKSMDDVYLESDDDQGASMCSLSTSDFLLLNIGGQSFKLTNATVARLPESSLLYQLAFGISDDEFCARFPHVRSKSFCLLADRREYFFDRSPELFQFILSYCFTGRIHCPDSANARVLEKELRFWNLRDVQVEKCCKPVVGDLGDNSVGIAEKVKHKESLIEPAALVKRMVSMTKKPTPREPIRCELTLPCCVKVFTGLSIFFLALSILNLILATEPSFQSSDCWFSPVKGVDGQGVDPLVLERLRQLLFNVSATDDGFWFFNTSDVWFESFSSIRQYINKPQVGQTDLTTLAPPRSEERGASGQNQSLDTNDLCVERQRKNFQTSCINSGFVFDLIEAVCMAWFTLEYLIRFMASRCRLAFLKNFLNIIDMLATIPFYVEIALDSLHLICYQYERVESFLAALKVLRVFRIIKLARYFRSLRVFGLVLVGSKRELVTITMFTSVTIIIFSSIIYYVEKDDPNTLYVSIPASFWWCIVTITTTGYGDMYPKTVGGKIVGAVACVSGILILAFPVSILTEHFMITYKRETPIKNTSVVQSVDDELDSSNHFDLADSKVPQGKYVNFRNSNSNGDDSGLDLDLDLRPTSTCYLEILDEEEERNRLQETASNHTRIEKF